VFCDCRYLVYRHEANLNSKFFQVTETSGIITTRSELDADIQRTFTLRILAVDQGAVLLLLLLLLLLLKLTLA